MAEPFRQSLLHSVPSRISTELSSAKPTSADAKDKDKDKKRSHLHGLHHHSHKHHHHHHHHHRSSRHHAKELVQSAFPSQPPTSFGDLLKQAKESISSSPSDSRRESVAVANAADSAYDRDAHDAGLVVPPRRPSVRPENLALEQKRVKIREQELRSSLQSLSDQSLKTSRRLDDTYYSLLERLAQCRQTINGLQELANLTNELHQNFEADTKELAEEVGGQFDGFNDFKQQQEQVTALENRIKVGKEKADALTARLDEARRRVDARAKLEAELEVRNTRHVRILWSIVGTIIGLILLSIIFQQFKPIHPDAENRHPLDFASREHILNAPIPDMAKEVIMTPGREQLDLRPSSGVIPAVNPADDPILRAFDEL